MVKEAGSVVWVAAWVDIVVEAAAEQDTDTARQVFLASDLNTNRIVVFEEWMLAGAEHMIRWEHC